MTNDAPMGQVKEQCKQWRESGQLRVCFAKVRWMRNDRTGETEVSAYLGCAPDENTVILYPIQVWKSGYWNKAHVRQQMNAAKRELFASMQNEGYSKGMLTQPIEMKSLEYF